MKHHHRLLLSLVLAISAQAATSAVCNAVTLTQAQLTLIVKDVRTIDPAKGAREATLKEILQGDQSVRTGIASRTELLFNDKSVTRLGANTHYSFSEGTRNMSLQNGVMLLQVPKSIGGARIETAAVTAGITGTTIMLDAGRKYTKLIVLEGKCTLTGKIAVGRGAPARFTRTVTAREGQEIIYPNGSPQMPDPIYLNLKVLEATSLLLTGKWPGNLNWTPITAAATHQKPEDFIPANGRVDGTATGAGANSVTTLSKLPQVPVQTNNPPPPPPVTPPTLPNRPPR